MSHDGSVVRRSPRTAGSAYGSIARVVTLSAAVAGWVSVGWGCGKKDCTSVCNKLAECSVEMGAAMAEAFGASGSELEKAKQEMNAKSKEMSAACDKECSATPEVKEKVGSCSTSNCMELMVCLSTAMPSFDKLSSGDTDKPPFHCMVEAESTCTEYTGAESSSSFAKGMCEAEKGKYATGLCPTADVLGTCDRDAAKPDATREISYTTGGKKMTLDDAKLACFGDFKAVGAPSAPASAEASAAPSASAAPDASATP